MSAPNRSEGGTPDQSGASEPVSHEQYERVIAALDQAVEALDLATSALAEDRLPQRAVLTAKLRDATRELHASVGTAVAGGEGTGARV